MAIFKCILFMFVFFLMQVAWGKPFLLELEVGKLKSISSSKYVLLESLNPHVLSVERDVFTKNFKLRAKQPGRTEVLLQEVGMPNVSRVSVLVAAPKKKSVKNRNGLARFCRRQNTIKFDSECSYIIPGWNSP